MLRTEVELLRAWFIARLLALRSEDRDRGSNSTDTVIWIAVIAAAAITIGAIIVAKIVSKANEVTLQ